MCWYSFSSSCNTSSCFKTDSCWNSPRSTYTDIKWGMLRAWANRTCSTKKRHSEIKGLNFYHLFSFFNISQTCFTFTQGWQGALKIHLWISFIYLYIMQICAIAELNFLLQQQVPTSLNILKESAISGLYLWINQQLNKLKTTLVKLKGGFFFLFCFKDGCRNATTAVGLQGGCEKTMYFYPKYIYIPKVFVKCCIFTENTKTSNHMHSLLNCQIWKIRWYLW